jgi:hypothetical protein
MWKNTPAMLNVFALIAQERVRQRELFHQGKITFDCASVIPDPNRKLRVLVEEVGEVAQELDRLEAAKDKRAVQFITEDLRTELVQVAAVAVAWLESFETWSARTSPRFETGRHVSTTESGDVSPQSKGGAR